MKDNKSFLEQFAPTFYLVIMVLMIAAIAPGCGNGHNTDVNDNHNNNANNTNPDDIVDITSVGYLAALTSDYDFAAADWDAWYELPLSSGVAVVTASEDLEVLADDGVEVWEVVSGLVPEFESEIRTYWTYEEWQPDLFPSDYGQAQDLEVLLSAFACTFAPEFTIWECPNWDMAEDLFRRVDNNGSYRWDNDDATKVVFLLRR